MIRFAAGIVVLLLCLSGCSAELDEATTPAKPTQVEDPRTDSTRKMAARLENIEREIDWPKVYSMASAKRIEARRSQLAKAINLKDKFELSMRLASELLKAGRTEEAIAEYDGLIKLLAAIGAAGNSPFRMHLLEPRGVAYLRLGEQQNCILNHSADSCLLPIRDEGLHRITEGSVKAVEIFTELLDYAPQEMNARWLLNIAYMTLGKYPDSVPEQWLIPESAFRSDYDIKRFRDVAPGAGVVSIGLSGGVVLDDLDGDGFLDLMVSDWAPDKQLRVFYNQADGRFVQRTKQAGLTGLTGGLNLIHADYDNDGRVDVVVLRGAWMDRLGLHPNSLLHNLGDGRFEDVTEQAGLLSFYPTQTADWADYNSDGLLDLFIGNESAAGARNPCELYRNNGDGTFTNVAAQVGLDHIGYVKAATWGDIDNDGQPDLYLSQFNRPNVLYRNDGLQPDGSWRFVDISRQAGVTGPSRSFPAWFWDFDNDGWEDLLVAPFAGFSFDGAGLALIVKDYLGEPAPRTSAALYHNNGDGTFTDVAGEMGLDASMLAMGANFGDLDNDGWLDAYFGTGDPYLGTLVPNRMFRNNQGQKFQDVTTSGGFGHIQKGHGIAFADVDNDGDQDIYAVMGGAVEGDVYQNVLFENPGHGNHWLTLRLVGTTSNRSAVGARIRVRVDTLAGTRDIYATVGSGGSFGSSSLQQEIGLGDALSIDSIEIRWPGDESIPQRLTAVPMDQALTVTQGSSELMPIALPAFKLNQSGGMHHADH